MSVDGGAACTADANGSGHSHPALEQAPYETTILRQSAGLSLKRTPDKTTILDFRRLLEKPEWAAVILGAINGYLGDRCLRQGTSSTPRMIHAPGSTRTRAASADPEMHQTRKGQLCCVGMTAHRRG